MNRAQRWTLIATVLASATVFLDSTIVKVALPRIGRELPTPWSASCLAGQVSVRRRFRTAMLIAAGLLVAGAAANARGIERQPQPAS